MKRGSARGSNELGPEVARLRILKSYLYPKSTSLSLRKLGGETLLYGLSNVLGRLLNFGLVTYFLTRLLDDLEFGIIGDLMFWTALLIALLVFRMDTAVFRFASRGDYDAGAVFSKAQKWVVGGVAVVIGVLLLLSPRIAEWVNYPDRVVWVWLVLITVAFDVLAMVPLARLRLEQRPWMFVGVNLGNVFVNILTIFVLLYVWRWNADWVADHWGWRYDDVLEVGYYLAAVAVASAFRYGLLLADGLHTYKRRGSADPDAAPHKGTPSLGTMLRYSAPLTLVAVAGIVNFLIGPSVVKYYHGGTVEENLAYAGQFNAALKLAVILNLFITAYTYAAEPFFFRQSGNDLATADRTIYADATRAYALIAVLASAGILLFLPWLELVVGAEFRPYLRGLVPILLGANFLFGLYANFSIAYKLTDQTLLGGGIATVGSLIVVGGGVLFTRAYGVYAPAWSMVACFAVMCTLAWRVSRRYFPVRYPLGRIALYPLLAAGAVGLADVWLPYAPPQEYTEAVFREGAAAGAMAGRGAVFLLLLVSLCGLERRWLRRTFL